MGEDGDVDVAGLAELRTPEGERALAAARELWDRGPLAAGAALRARGFAPHLAAAALGQVELRHRATAKFGADATLMFFTRSGLEQATRAEVADRRARRFAAAGVTRLADLGCGIGADAFANARAGIKVDAVDADPLTAAVAAANAQALGLDVTAAVGRAEEVDLMAVNAAFCDPARRRSPGETAGRPGARDHDGTDRRGRAPGHPRGASTRIFDPEAFSPPWTFVRHLVDAVPATVLKLAPGIDHALIPPGAEAEWVSVDGDVVEAAFWCGPLAQVTRRATVLRGGLVQELVGKPDEAPVGLVRGYVHDPDGAVVRAHLVATLADRIGGVLADPNIAYVYTDAPTPTPFGRAYEIRDVMPFSLKRLREALRARGVGRLTIKKRGSALVPEQLRRDLRLSGSGEATIILTRVAGAPTVLLCDPVGGGG